MRSKRNLSMSIRRSPLSKRIRVAAWLAALLLLLLPVLTAAQESEKLPTTSTLKTKLQEQLQRNETDLQNLRTTAQITEPQALQEIFSQSGATMQPRARAVEVLTPPDCQPLNFRLVPDATTRVCDSNQLKGVILTGKWIVEYSRLIKLIPEYDKTLDGYREQVKLQDQIAAKLEGTLGIKDKEIAVLEEMGTALTQRGDLYKQLSEIHQDSFFTKALRKLAFPAGITVGFIMGVVAANAN